MNEHNELSNEFEEIKTKITNRMYITIKNTCIILK